MNLRWDATEKSSRSIKITSFRCKGGTYVNENGPHSVYVTDLFKCGAHLHEASPTQKYAKKNSYLIEKIQKNLISR